MKSAFKIEERCRLVLPAVILSALSLQQPLCAQDFSRQMRENGNCYSCLFKDNAQSIPLLTLPSSLEGRQSAIDRSLGGISGSSFQTQEATPEQVIRQVEKAPRQPVFNLPGTFATEVRVGGIPAETQSQSFAVQKSFEEHFGEATSTAVDQSFRLYAPRLNRTLKILGERRKRGALDIFSSDLEE